MANALAVSITANIVDLQTKFGVAKAETNALASEFNKLARASAAGSLDAAGQARFQQVASDMLHARQAAAALGEQLEKSGASFANFGARATQTTGGIGGALQELQGKFATAMQFTGIGIAIAGFEKLAQAVSRLGERAAEMRSTADVLGVSIQEYQAMSAAADQAGVSTETLARFAERLVGILQQARDGSGEAAEKLKLLGISNQQIASSTFGVNDVLGVLHARLTDVTTAQQEHNEILAQFGPRGANAIEVIKTYSGSVAQVAALMRELNGVNAQQAKSAAELHAKFEEFGIYLSNTFTKGLAAYSQWLQLVSERQQSAVSAVKAAFSAPASSPALEATVQVPSIAPQVRADAAQAQAAMAQISITAHKVTLDELNDMREVVAAARQGSAERLAAERELYEATRSFYGSDQIDKVRAQYRELAAEQRAFADAQLQAEGQATAAMQRSASIKKQLIDEQLAESQKYLTQEREITQIDADSAIAIGRMKLQAQLDELNGEFAAHKITAQQKLAVSTQLTQQLAELDKQQLQNELAVQEPRTAAYERAADKILEIQAKLNVDLAALQRQFVTESQKDAQQQVSQWQKAVGEIENAEGSLTSDLLSRRKSLSQSLLQIGAQLVQQEIANDVRALTSKMLLGSQEKALDQGGLLYHGLVELQKWVQTESGQTNQTAAVVAGNTARQTANASAAAVGRAQQAAIQGPSIMADAAKAFSGTYASVASIPIVGWILAPAAAAGAFAAVAAYEGLASLAEGAWEIPQSGLYHLHEGEAVAPVPFARGMREATGGAASAGTGRGSASTGESTGDVHHHWNVTATDAQSFERMISNPGYRRAISKAATAHARSIGYRLG
jgi:hypothetical protein